MTTESLEQIRLQLMWNRLIAIVEEQAQTLMRTAFSTPVREAGDLSAGVFDTHGRMLAQAVTGTPGHVNAMAASVKRFLDKHPIEQLEPGDVLLTNDPWHGTGHLNDFTAVSPTFLDDQCVALFAATSHIADVGGLGFGADAREVFEEGLNVPISFLFRRGELNQTLIEILRSNVRDPASAEGDWYSLAACNRTGSARLIDMMREFGLRNLDELGHMIVTNSRDAMLEEIRKLNYGTYGNSMRIDGYDDPVDLVCALTIDDDGIELDFAGTSGLSPRGINVPLTYTAAYASFGVRCVIGNDVPNNAGSLEVIRVSAPAGSILNAPPPSAVSARHAVGQLLPDVVLGCLEQVLGAQVPAEGASCLWLPVLLSGRVQDSRDSFVINPFYTGGTGARPSKDGLSTTAFPSGVRNTPSEINETTAPLIVWRKEYRQDSGGPGKFRGGLGQVIEIGHAEDAPFMVSKMFDRIKHAPRGRSGGGRGRGGRVYTSDGTTLRGMGRDDIPGGRNLVMETPGGGGIGNPLERDRALVKEDVRNGLVSRQQAIDAYGMEAEDLDE